MQKPQGHVISVSVDESGNRAVVEIDSVPACERCESGKGCGAGLLGQQSGEKRVEAAVANNLDVRRGDRVSIELSSRNILRAAVIVYGYPLSGGVLAAIAALGMGLGDLGGACAALVGLVGGIGVAKIRINSRRCLREFTPMVVDRLSSVPD
jgi:positive regulator of sigma E activity